MSLCTPEGDCGFYGLQKTTNLVSQPFLYTELRSNKLTQDFEYPTARSVPRRTKNKDVNCSEENLLRVFGFNATSSLVKTIMPVKDRILQVSSKLHSKCGEPGRQYKADEVFSKIRRLEKMTGSPKDETTSIKHREDIMLTPPVKLGTSTPRLIQLAKFVERAPRPQSMIRMESSRTSAKGSSSRLAVVVLQASRSDR